MRERQSKTETKLSPREKALELVNAYFDGKDIIMKDPARGVPDWVSVRHPEYWSYLTMFCKNVNKLWESGIKSDDIETLTKLVAAEVAKYLGVSGTNDSELFDGLINLIEELKDKTENVLESNIDTEMNVKTSKGQTLIQQNSKLNVVHINNESSYLKFEDSEIHTLVVENKSGTINFKNLKGMLMQVNSTRSVNTLNNIAYKELNVTLSSSSKLTISKTYVDTVKIDISSSQLVLDYVKGDINIISKSSTLNISGVGSNLEDAKAEYNNSSLVTNLTINNSGNSCKTDIIDCILNNFSITQDGGFIKVKQSTINEGMVNAANCETIDLIDLSGTTIDLYFSDIAQTIIIDAETKTGLKYIIKVIDTLTFARMLVDEEVIDITNEAVTPNE